MYFKLLDIMKNKKITSAILLMSFMLWTQLIFGQSHTIFPNNMPNDNTSFNDVISFEVPILLTNGTTVMESRTVMVGQRSQSPTMAANTSAIIICINANKQIIWQREVNPTINNRNCGFNKVIRANDGNIVVIGFNDAGVNFAASSALIAIYNQLNGNLMGINTFFTSSPNVGGDIFYDLVQNPNITDNRIFVCGSRNSSPNDANSIIAAINYPALTVNWYNEYPVTLSSSTQSDAFTTIDWLNNNLYVFGVWQSDNEGFPSTDYDITHIAVNQNQGNVIYDTMIDIVGTNQNEDSDWPIDLHIDRNNGSFLLSGIISNDFGATLSNTHFVLNGRLGGNLLVITGANEFRNNNIPIKGAWENNIAIRPLNIQQGNYYLIQSPGTIFYGSNGNMSANNTSTLESSISLINGFTNVQSTFRLGIIGRQWLSGIHLNTTTGTLDLVGSSFDHPNQSTRDAYLFSTPINFGASSGECSIVLDTIVRNTPNLTRRNIAFQRTPFTPTNPISANATPQLLPKDLCFSPCIDSFTNVIDSNLTIVNNTMFHGKYYIKSNVILTVASGVTLDLTNVDMIFGECAGIDVIGKIRANNSVFRPCEENKTWRGIRFLPNSDNSKLNSNTFKNAEVALYFIQSDTQQINANVFVNCKWGIYSNSSTFSNPISSNDMSIDANYPNLNYSCNMISANAIPSFMQFTNNSRVNTEIFGNEMIKNGEELDDYYGIISVNSFVKTISKNDFTNLKRGVFVNSSPNSPNPIGLRKINNNDFERQNNSGTNVEAQIQIENCKFPLEIESNTIKANSAVTGAAIDIISSSQINILENKIEGFQFGIFLNNVNNSSVIRNEIKKATTAGIISLSASNVVTKCNTIDMDHNLFGILQANSLNCVLESNCIFNSSHSSIVFLLNCQNSTVLNNYMYNYGVFGVWNLGEANLFIGNNPTHGQNTFWSNSNAIDINTNPGNTTNCYNNFGINSIGGNTLITGPASVNSTASCGHQIYNLPSQQKGIIYNCNPINGLGEIPDDVEIEEFLRSLSHSDERLKVSEEYYSDLLLKDQSKAAMFKNELSKENHLTTNEMKWLTLLELKHKGDFEQALKIANSIQIATEESQIKLALEIIKLESTLGISDLYKLDLNLINKLNTFYSKNNNEYNNELALLLSNNNVAVALQSSKPFELALESVSNVKRRIISDDFVKIYPNPAVDKLNIQYSFVGDNKLTKIAIYDIMGKLINETEVDVLEGQFNIDISNLSQGKYIIKIQGSDSSLVKSFVKM